MKTIKSNLFSALFCLITFAGISQSKGFETIKNLELMGEVFEHLELYFVDDSHPSTLAKKGIDEMLKDLDPYTVFIHESDIEDYRLLTTGEYGGIGALIRKVDEYVYITDPYENMPAHLAGLKGGDKILSIDQRDMKGKSSEEVSSFLKGPKGSRITLVVERLKAGKLEIDVVRDEIKLKDVPYSGMLDSEIGYVKLNSFTQTAGIEVQEAMQDLFKKGMQKMILDLRGNGGGLLMEAVKIVNFFVPKNQLVVNTKGRLVEENRSYNTLAEPIAENLPLVILIDENSASASEIVAGSLQDLDRAVIVGQTSFGKGLVQRTYNLSYGSKIKLTIAKYYTPSGRCVQRLEYYDKKGRQSVEEVPDSLLQKFKTANGREVTDGRGIEPDVHVELESLNNLTLQLITQNLIFHYTNEYQSNHIKIDSLKEFILKQEDYDDFVKFVLNRKFEYKTRSNEEFKRLQEAINEDNVSVDIQKLMDELRENLAPDIERDLMKYQNQIKDLLQNDIVGRYYFQKGQKEDSFKKDSTLIKGLEILKQNKEYKKILNKE